MIFLQDSPQQGVHARQRCRATISVALLTLAKAQGVHLGVEVTKPACDLLNHQKQLLSFNWRQKSGAPATPKLAIEDVLDASLPLSSD